MPRVPDECLVRWYAELLSTKSLHKYLSRQESALTSRIHPEAPSQTGAAIRPDLRVPALDGNRCSANRDRALAMPLEHQAQATGAGQRSEQRGPLSPNRGFVPSGSTSL